MQLLNYLLAIGMVATVSAAPKTSPAPASLLEKSAAALECPFPDGTRCLAHHRSACLGSDHEICNDGHFGGPSKPCDDFCRAEAKKACGDAGCCPYLESEEYLCHTDVRSACHARVPEPCVDDPYIGGPSPPCFEFCRDEAIRVCTERRCCPYMQLSTCVSDKRNTCERSGLEICKDRPSTACTDFCTAQAGTECAAVGCA